MEANLQWVEFTSHPLFRIHHRERDVSNESSLISLHYPILNSDRRIGVSDFKKPLRRQQRKRSEKNSIGRTALHVRFETLYTSWPSTAKQRQNNKFNVVW